MPGQNAQTRQDLGNKTLDEYPYPVRTGSDLSGFLVISVNITESAHQPPLDHANLRRLSAGGPCKSGFWNDENPPDEQCPCKGPKEGENRYPWATVLPNQISHQRRSHEAEVYEVNREINSS